MTAIAKAEKILTPLTRTEWYLHEDGRIDRWETEKFVDGGEVSIGPVYVDSAPVGLTWTHIDDARTIRVEEDYDVRRSHAQLIRTTTGTSSVPMPR